MPFSIASRDANIVIMAAAVADYRPAAAHEKKLKRGEGSFTLELEPTPDILAELGRDSPRRAKTAAVSSLVLRLKPIA